MKQVLFDSDVVLDVLANREPFVIASAKALDTIMQERSRGYISGHAVTNIFYILRRQVGREAAIALLARLLANLQIASVTDSVIRAALQSSMTDFEDAVTSEAAHALALDFIVTRNTRDFRQSLVPAIQPEAFCASLSE
ncbi:MAG: PIN domain-containing protein [Cyanobacteria bacterium P01_F01_bin.150]